MSLVPMADAQSVGQIKPKTNAGTVATPKPVATPVALTNPVEIDEKLSTCLQVNGSTAGMIRCLEEASDRLARMATPRPGDNQGESTSRIQPTKLRAITAPVFPWEKKRE